MDLQLIQSVSVAEFELSLPTIGGAECECKY